MYKYVHIQICTQKIKQQMYSAFLENQLACIIIFQKNKHLSTPVTG